VSYDLLAFHISNIFLNKNFSFQYNKETFGLALYTTYLRTPGLGSEMDNPLETPICFPADFPLTPTLVHSAHTPSLRCYHLYPAKTRVDTFVNGGIEPEKMI